MDAVWCRIHAICVPGRPSPRPNLRAFHRGPPSPPISYSFVTPYDSRQVNTLIPDHPGPLKHQRPLRNPPPLPLQQRQLVRIEPVQIQHGALVRPLAEQARLHIRRDVRARTVINRNSCRPK
jgi:hypothetical protein